MKKSKVEVWNTALVFATMEQQVTVSVTVITE